VPWAAEPFRIFIFGGSQGAVGINRLVVAALSSLRDLKGKIFLHHQTGTLDFETVRKGYEQAEWDEAQVEAYVYDMVSAYRSAQLVICRAGASSIAELAAAAKAAFLIPLVSKDRHQEPNAEELAKHSAAEFALQPDLTGEKFAAIIRDFYYNREKLKKYSKEIQKLHHSDAAEKIADVCISTIKEKSTS
jgi:UDP-N-acetylglucosamine--N-acetylmuramyl-(pentapeptide) pyrophosphoryl-undecaprenol N-acetylglucosamine transferase